MKGQKKKKVEVREKRKLVGVMGKLVLVVHTHLRPQHLRNRGRRIAKSLLSLHS